MGKVLRTHNVVNLLVCIVIVLFCFTLTTGFQPEISGVPSISTGVVTAEAATNPIPPSSDDSLIDLEPMLLIINPPYTRTNQPVNIIVEIFNNGSLDTSDFQVDFYANNSFIGCNTTSITAGRTYKISITWSPTSPGTYQVEIIVDSLGVIVERDETNNILSEILNVKADRFVEGTGTFFEIANHACLNIALTSSEPIHLRMESFERMISLSIDGLGSTNSTHLFLSGFESNATYYRYQDGNLMEAFTTDLTGGYVYIQDLSKHHHVCIQKEESTIVIWWDFTFPVDLEGTIMVIGNDIVIDGANHILDGKYTSSFGFYLNGIHGVTIKNVIIQNFVHGIFLDSCSDITITYNALIGNDYGISLRASSGTKITINYLEGQLYSNIYLFVSSYNSILSNWIRPATCGIYLEESLYNVISNNIIEAASGFKAVEDSGIGLIKSSHNVISHNNMTDLQYDLEYGISVVLSSENTIFDNNISSDKIKYGITSISSASNNISYNFLAPMEIGISVVGSHYNTIYKNNVSSHRVINAGINVLVSVSTNISCNFIATYQIGISVGVCSYSTVFDNRIASRFQLCGIYIFKSVIINVSHNEIISHELGISILSSNSVNISINSIAFSQTGISSVDSEFLNVSSNALSKNENSIMFDNSSKSNISHNIIRLSKARGIYLTRFSGNNIITHNDISNHESEIAMEGISLTLSSNNEISYNNISYYFYGITFLVSASDNTVFDNYIKINVFGVLSLESGFNVIYHNCFESNTYHASELGDQKNSWYNSELLEGNYWDTYPGSDDGSGSGKHAIAYDGIGDTWIPWDGTQVTPGFDEYPYICCWAWRDTTPPNTTIEFKGTLGQNNWYISNVNAYLTAMDYEEIVLVTRYSFDEINWVEYKGGITIAAEGITTIYFYSIDCAGNEENTQNATVKIDKTKPTTQIKLSGHLGSNDWYTSDVTVTLEATDAEPGSGIWLMMYQVDGGTWTNYATPFKITDEGTHVIVFSSMDRAGNTNSIFEYVKIDKTSPQIVCIPSEPPGPTGWYLSPVDVVLTAADDLSGLALLEYSLDDGITWQSGPLPIFISNEGGTTIHYRAQDKAGNLAHASLTIHIDTIAPLTSLDLLGILGSNDWYVSDVTLTLDAEDATSGVAGTWYSFDEITWFPSNELCPLTEEGSFTIYYYSADIAGNMEPIKSALVQIDKTVPITSLEIGPHYEDEGLIYVTSATEFNLTATDETSGIASTFYRINEDAWMEYTGSIYLLGEAGNYIIEYYSEDVAGHNEAPQSLTVVLVSFEVTSYLAKGETPITYFDVIFTKDKQSGGYKLVATNPGQIFYIIEYRNDWPFPITTLTLDAIIPDDFMLKGSNPIHVYLEGCEITHLCSIEGTTIIIENVEVNSQVFVKVHLDYALKNSVFETLETFGLRGYIFAISAVGSLDLQPVPSDSLDETKIHSTTLIAHQKKTTVIAGYVTDVNGNPIVGVTVKLYDFNGFLVAEAITDENGFYYFLNIEAGAYTLQTTVNGQMFVFPAIAVDRELVQLDFIIG